MRRLQRVPQVPLQKEPLTAIEGPRINYATVAAAAAAATASSSSIPTPLPPLTTVSAVGPTMTSALLSLPTSLFVTGLDVQQKQQQQQQPMGPPAPVPVIGSQGSKKRKTPDPLKAAARTVKRDLTEQATVEKKNQRTHARFIAHLDGYDACQDSYGPQHIAEMKLWIRQLAKNPRVASFFQTTEPLGSKQTESVQIASLLSPDVHLTSSSVQQGTPCELTLIPRISADFELPNLPVPFDAFSFDGKFGISCLTLESSGHPNLCRFNFCPESEVEHLMGAVTAKTGNLQEAYIYPSLCTAVKRAHAKSVDAWMFLYVMVVNPKDGRTYRITLDQFKEKKKFVVRPGFKYEKAQLEVMKNMANQMHIANKQRELLSWPQQVRTMGTHRPLDLIPSFLENLLQVIPSIIIPHPDRNVICKAADQPYFLPPVNQQHCPTFVLIADPQKIQKAPQIPHPQPKRKPKKKALKNS